MPHPPAAGRRRSPPSRRPLPPAGAGRLPGPAGRPAGAHPGPQTPPLGQGMEKPADDVLDDGQVRGHAPLDRRLPTQTSWPDLLNSRSLLSISRRGYQAENIPREIPAAWLDVLLGRDRAAYAQTIRALRRLTAIQLVQAAETSTMREAARFLGIPSAWFTDQTKRVLPFDRLPKLRDGQDLARALERLAQHVENDPTRSTTTSAEGASRPGTSRRPTGRPSRRSPPSSPDAPESTTSRTRSCATARPRSSGPGPPAANGAWHPPCGLRSPPSATPTPSDQNTASSTP